MKQRNLVGIINPIQTLEGAGVPIKRFLPTNQVRFEHVDPFLLLDEVSLPADIGEAFPDHPHRGFEIVTAIIEGSAQHKDSNGNTEVLKAGDVQKITAGAGIWHGEGPVKNQPFQGLQLWVNLPRDLKKIPADYQIVKKSEFTTNQIESVEVTPIVGDKAPIKLQKPTLYQRIHFIKDDTYSPTIDKTFNVLIYIQHGLVTINDKTISEDKIAVLGPGSQIEIHGTADTRCVILAAQPIDEPVLWHGPFVD